MTISVKYNSILVDISLTPWRISVSSFSRRRISVSSVIKQVPEIQIIYFTSYYLNPLPMFEEFSHLKSLGESQSLPHTMKAGKARYLLSQPPPPPPPRLSCSQVSGTWPGFCLSEAGVSDTKKVGQCQIFSGGKEHLLDCRGSNDSGIHPAPNFSSAGGGNSGIVWYPHG